MSPEEFEDEEALQSEEAILTKALDLFSRTRSSRPPARMPSTRSSALRESSPSLSAVPKRCLSPRDQQRGVSLPSAQN